MKWSREVPDFKDFCDICGVRLSGGKCYNPKPVYFSNKLIILCIKVHKKTPKLCSLACCKRAIGIIEKYRRAG